VNLIRNVGGAIGLAILTTVLSDQTAAHLAELSAGMSVASLQAQDMLEGLTGMMQVQGIADPEGAARKFLGMALRRDASVLAFGDGFFFLAAGCAVASFLGIFAKPGKGAAPAGGGH
jgi:DHA2 family multidrug resistance protein